uniref:Sosondowah ankyrin repeat domain family d n=1 Tax=Salarias fasciatus TaxID=181472 RepID=A0A672GW29_SALFA
MDLKRYSGLQIWSWLQHGGGIAQEPSRKDIVVQRLSSYGIQVMPGAFQRRSRLQRQQEASSDSCVPGGVQRDAPERGSVTPAVRKKYPKELLGNPSANSGGQPPEQDTDWALYRMEHAWMLSAVEGNYETILEFLSEDPQLLTRRDFISGYSALHWLAKRGQHETLIKLLRHAEKAGIPVNVNLRGSGGLTPLHVASIHGQYMVVKLLVGAFGANVDAMDYSGRRAWQYLRGDAPPEMRELLGTWDDEHSPGCARGGNKNGNNNCAPEPGACEEVESAETEERDRFDRTHREDSWRFGSIRKLLPSFSFLGSKS